MPTVNSRVIPDLLTPFYFFLSSYLSFHPFFATTLLPPRPSQTYPVTCLLPRARSPAIYRSNQFLIIIIQILIRGNRHYLQIAVHTFSLFVPAGEEWPSGQRNVLHHSTAVNKALYSFETCSWDLCRKLDPPIPSERNFISPPAYRMLPTFLPERKFLLGGPQGPHHVDSLFGDTNEQNVV